MKIDVLDKGFVELMDFMGGDITVVNAARVSFGKQKTELDDDDKKLIKFLTANKHMSPLRHVQLQFRIKAPEFVMRQAYKHNVGIGWTDMRVCDLAWNEVSGRYTEYKPEYYVPSEWRKQSKDNKQATTDETLNKKESIFSQDTYNLAVQHSFEAYEYLLGRGVGKEQARCVLPLCIYTEVIMTTSLEAICNFIRLRDHEGAQWEIRQYANAFRELTKTVAPLSMEALGV
jgi:thymidylate synthase (FAD)